MRDRRLPSFAFCSFVSTRLCTVLQTPIGISSRHSDVVSMLIVGVSKSGQAAITPHLGLYATSLLEQLVEHRCSVRPLRASEGYRDASTSTPGQFCWRAYSSSENAPSTYVR